MGPVAASLDKLEFMPDKRPANLYLRENTRPPDSLTQPVPHLRTRRTSPGLVGPQTSQKQEANFLEVANGF